jgi:hypothetical protein
LHHEPFENCWENDIFCPLGYPPRNLNVYESVRTLAWLLAELRYENPRGDLK